MEGSSQRSREAQRPHPPGRVYDRRQRLKRRALPLAGVALAAMLAGLVAGALHVPAARSAADRFVDAWARGDYVEMHDMLTGDAATKYSLASFTAAYRESAVTSTSLRFTHGHAKDPDGDTVSVPITVSTRIFGRVRATLKLPFSGDRVAWRPDLSFPGLGEGQRLTRQTELPPRAAILARDGRVLAQGADRSSPSLSNVAGEIVGQLGPVPPERRDALYAQGYPDGAQVGISGLERALNDQLTGRPGGTLSAGGRVIARSVARAAPGVRSTISPKIQQAAVNALGGRDGAITVMRPDGQVLGLAGFAFSGKGPPGSTFKIITTTAALELHKVKLSDQFPVRTAAILSGVPLNNAGGESCGGSFPNAFAQSCNSVFAPLGAKVGGPKLVEMAERYGFNEPTSIDGAVVSSIPPGDQIGDDLAVGSTAIGQGMVEASTLQMAEVAATIGDRGRRPHPTLLLSARPVYTRVTTPAVAATIRGLMVGVVKFGTGTAAQIKGVTVAGKTGTAELGGAPGGGNVAGNTDAWFVAFAPARAPRVVIAVVMSRAGAGGAAAAPVAHDVLVTALKGQP